ncbi:MAG: DNA methyltransferase, partial [Candidatus Thorarchaeota archaeon]
PGDWVADIFSGSGGTLLASRELGRSCISIEKNPDYKKIIEQKAKVNKEIVFNREDRPDSEKKAQVGLDSFSNTKN